MRVLQVNNQLHLGGAETVMHQLHEGLITHGHESQLCVAEGKTYPRNVLPLYPRIPSRLHHSRLHSIAEEWAPRNAWTDRNFRKLAGTNADLIHLHNFHGNYASVASLAHVAEHAKVVWTFHALWGITGGCDHPRDCARYQDRCGACPQLGQWPVGEIDDTAGQLEEKLARLSPLPLHIVAPSRWLAEVDPSQFAPAARKPDKITILIVNRNFSDAHKGFPMVREALSMIAPARIRLVLAGAGSRAAVAELQRFHCIDAGYIRDRRELAALYGEADIFLFASEAENFPCVILEAMASECCVIATPTGGVVEQIDDHSSGLLAREISGEALGEALRVAIGDAGLRQRLGIAARERVLAHFTEARMVASYLDLYQEVIRAS
jgi:glycosyltransferase involved in cell wall biosynthesis